MTRIFCIRDRDRTIRDRDRTSKVDVSTFVPSTQLTFD